MIGGDHTGRRTRGGEACYGPAQRARSGMTSALSNPLNALAAIFVAFSTAEESSGSPPAVP